MHQLQLLSPVRGELVRRPRRMRNVRADLLHTVQSQRDARTFAGDHPGVISKAAPASACSVAEILSLACAFTPSIKRVKCLAAITFICTFPYDPVSTCDKSSQLKPAQGAVPVAMSLLFLCFCCLCVIRSFITSVAFTTSYNPVSIISRY